MRAQVCDERLSVVAEEDAGVEWSWEEEQEDTASSGTDLPMSTQPVTQAKSRQLSPAFEEVDSPVRAGQLATIVGGEALSPEPTHACQALAGNAGRREPVSAQEAVAAAAALLATPAHAVTREQAR